MEHDYRNDLYLINNSMQKKLNLRFINWLENADLKSYYKVWKTENAHLKYYNYKDLYI